MNNEELFDVVITSGASFAKDRLFPKEERRERLQRQRR